MNITNYINRLRQFSYKKTSYSQEGEDLLVIDLFPLNYKGIYVDVGAHHPIRFSNTYLFYKKGWRGINIDATPNSMDSFKLLRSKDVNIEIGIGAKESTIIFYCFNEPALNTFDPTVAAKQENDKYRIIKQVPVKVEPLQKVLENYSSKIGDQIDILNIDVEGLDFEVLQSLSWDNQKPPKVILIEDHDFSIQNPNQSKIYSFLTPKGYELKAMSKRTKVYQLIYS